MFLALARRVNMHDATTSQSESNRIKMFVRTSGITYLFYMETNLIELSQITEIELDGVDRRDYPDFCDAFICAAVWKDSGKALTNKELEQIDSSELNVLIHERLF